MVVQMSSDEKPDSEAARSLRVKKDKTGVNQYEACKDDIEISTTLIEGPNIREKYLIIDFCQNWARQGPKGLREAQ